MKRFLALFAALLLAFSLAAGAEAIQAEDVLSGILNFKATQSGADNVPDWVASHLPAAMGRGGEWYAIGLGQHGGFDLSACRTALLDYVGQAKVRSATTKQKLALTLLATGGETAFVSETLADSIGKQGVMSWAWGLHLLNNGCESPDYTADEVVQTLLSLRKADGGWAVTGSVSDVDVTAMVLQALAPHRGNAEAADAIDNAVKLLSECQLEDGGFASYGVENAESTAQVIIALCALEINPVVDARFIKDGAAPLDALYGFRLEDGSFCHEKGGVYSESATVQAFLAAEAVQRYQAGEGSLYQLDAKQPGQTKTAWGYKPIAAAILCGGAGLVCIVLLLIGKRHPKNFLAVAILTAILVAFVFLTDFQSAASYYSADVIKTDPIGQATLTIRCDKVAGKAAHIPADGVILPETALPIAAGDTVYTILTDAARAHGFHLEASGASGLIYINGIGNIYEFDFGDLSGWIYLVNGEPASVGCDQYVLKPGDQVAFHYTLNLGRDID